MEELLKNNSNYIKNISGISKRIYIAFSELINSRPDVENILFNLCAVVDSNSKLAYPTENGSRKRFIDYINSNQDDLLFVYFEGIRFLFDGFWDSKKNKRVKISEILYEVRCCSYHDPEELKNYISIENTNKGMGLSKIDQKFAYSLFLILLSDTNNKNRIDKKLFEFIGKITNKQKNVHLNLIDVIGERQKLLDFFKKD